MSVFRQAEDVCFSMYAEFPLARGREDIHQRSGRQLEGAWLGHCAWAVEFDCLSHVTTAAGKVVCPEQPSVHRSNLCHMCCLYA